MNSQRLFGAISLAIVLVGLQVQPWALLLGILFLAWKASVEFKGLAKPSRWLTNSLTVLFLALVLAKYRTLAGQESSASFLLLLTSLKLLEERTLRDQKFLLLLGFVLLSSLFLFTLELPSLFGGLVGFYLLWTSQNSSLAYGKHFAKALPYVAFLFLFFPRVQNPFGLQGASVPTGTTGFGDDMNPGSISKIQTSHDLAFRVQFINPNLKAQALRTQDQYWRGQVLRFNEGLRWSKKPSPQQPIDKTPVDTLDYELTLEPHGNRWLFAWETTSRLQSTEVAFFQRASGVFESFIPLRDRITYRGKIGAAATGATDPAENVDLQTPQVEPSVQDFATKTKVQYKTPQAIANAYLNFFRAGGFYYSKNPGTGSSTLSNFLFKNKKGYCEHYAATLATLLRLAGVPARVVTGYQGGQYNGYGKFWRFTQADAHAWVEFLNDEKTWQRIDPTSVVAPERIELGGLLFEDLPEEWIGQGKSSEFLKSREAWWIRTRDFIQDSAESLNYDIVLFLIDFNLEKQKELLSEYGLWALLAALVLLSPFVVQSFLRRRKPSNTEWLLSRLEKQGKTLGLHREKSETLRAFLERWKQRHPEHTDPLRNILISYEQSEYAPSTPGFDLKHLKAALKTLKETK